MRSLAPEISTWTWFSDRFGYDFNGFWVRHPSGNLCIDPVQMSEETLGELASLGVAKIVLTNRNHFRDAERLRARTGAEVMVHPADAAFVREKGVTLGAPLAIGQEVGPFTVVAAEGKSPGEVALYWPKRRILIVGDICVGNPPGALGLLPEAVMDDPAALRRSLQRLEKELDLDTLLVGDGASILAGARAAMRALCASFGQ